MHRGFQIRCALVVSQAALLRCASATLPPDAFTYRQSIIVDCPTRADAEALQVTPCPLPFGRKVAASTRWDDTNSRHVNTHEVLLRNGWKGTFYLNATTVRDCAPLTIGGCSIGTHTLTHPNLASRNANELFFEIMGGRVQCEACSDQPINTAIFPYNNCIGWTADTQDDIGESLRRAGLIGVPDAADASCKLATGLGFARGDLAQSRVILPGDQDVSVEAADREIHAALTNAAALAANPSFSIGEHSLHTPEGLRNLDLVLQMYGDRPDWWYCNQTDYAAYRYEFNHCAVTKRVEGTRALFDLTRLSPGELGAAMPLWFTLKGFAPASRVTGATTRHEADGDFLEAPPAAGLLPTVVATVSNSVNAAAAAAVRGSSKLPGLQAGLHAEIEHGHALELVLRNAGSRSLRDLAIVFIAPPGWQRGRTHQALAELPPGASVALRADLGAQGGSFRYRLGRPYFVAQVDFTEAAGRRRLLATTRCPASPLPDACPFVTLRILPVLPPEGDPAAISIFGVDLAARGLRPQEIPADLEKMAPWIVPIDKKALPAGPFRSAAVYDFESDDGRSIETLTAWKAQLFLNGRPLHTEGRTWTLQPVVGHNRLVAVYPDISVRPYTTYMSWKDPPRFLPPRT